MGKNTKGSENLEKCMEKEDLKCLMDLFMKGSFRMTKSMDMEIFSGIVKEGILEGGRMDRCMVKESIILF